MTINKSLASIVAIALSLSPPTLVANGKSSAKESVVQSFFSYLLQPKTDIATNTAAQNRWLTVELKKLLRASRAAVIEARKLPEVNGPDPKEPDNGTFLDAWNSPTNCLVSKAIPTIQPDRVNVVCRWGPKTQYPGTQKKGTIFLQRQSGAWRISNIQFYEGGEYHRQFDLVFQLRDLKTESERLIAQYKKKPYGND